jgi:hypothetical protein
LESSNTLGEAKSFTEIENAVEIYDSLELVANRLYTNDPYTLLYESEEETKADSNIFMTEMEGENEEED